MAKRCIVVDVDKCSGCDSCVVACKFENNIGLGTYWSAVKPVNPVGEHPNIDMYWVPMMCQQCENSPCVGACTSGATYRDPDNNVVLIDKELCIGCKSCFAACPYSDPEGSLRPSARWFNEDENVAEKCTLCNHITATSDGNPNRLDSQDPEHAVPPCVHNCSCGARYFGDLDDPDSGASKALAQAEADGRGIHMIEADGVVPATRYILSEEIAEWRGLGA